MLLNRSTRSKRSLAVAAGIALTLVLAMAGTTLIAGDPAPEGSIAVRGDLPRTGLLTVADLDALGPQPVTWKHRGASYEFAGVPLEKVLAHFGVTAGDMDESAPKSEKRAGYKFVIVATAPDGFQAVYSFAEIAATNGAPSKVYLVWMQDGKPLPPETGPFRLVATTDGEGARSIYRLASLDVVDMRRIVPAEDLK